MSEQCGAARELTHVAPDAEDLSDLLVQERGALELPLIADGGRDLGAKAMARSRRSSSIHPRVRLSDSAVNPKETTTSTAMCLSKPVRPTRLLNALVEMFATPEGAARSVLAPAPVALSPADAPQRPLLILVAEDNRVNQQVIARMLARAGHRADIVVDGREAVTALGGTAYDLVLMDCLMPEMDGFEAARAIRAAEGGTGRHIPIIALTASAMAEDRERCLAAGMDDYLTKPLTKGALIEALERWGALSADAPKAV